jgi:hypothetical protein
MGHPDALKGRVGQAESGKKGISPADGAPPGTAIYYPPPEAMSIETALY